MFLRYVRSLYPPGVRLGLVVDNFSPHLSTRTDRRVADWAVANDVELAYVPTNASWLNRIEAQFQAHGPNAQPALAQALSARRTPAI